MLGPAPSELRALHMRIAGNKPGPSTGTNILNFLSTRAITAAGAFHI